MKIGIIKERKARVDNRVALTPKQCMSLMAKFPNIEVFLEPSDIRCYSDDEYIESGVKISEDMEQCDVLIGVKEVPIENLIAGKTYFFFSHTIKKQEYNKALLKALVDLDIRMIDYEGLVYPDGGRVLGFGHWAGVVGAHNGLLNYGKKTQLFDLPPAHSFTDYRAMRNFYDEQELPPMRIAITGSGKVAMGALQVMDLILAEQRPLQDMKTADNLAFGHFSLERLYVDNEGVFDKGDFFAHPEKYVCTFREQKYGYDILMNGIYWNKNIDRLFDAEDISQENWSIQTIADISCDIGGSVPINLASTNIAEPSYGVDRKSLEKIDPYQSFGISVDVMAVDNLPNELPRDASATFGEQMLREVIPELLNPSSQLLQTGTICEKGALTDRFAYLTDFYNS